MASRRAASTPPLPTRPPLDLEITVISAKHLKNVNWRNGDLKPYVVAYVDPDRRAATKPDDSGGIKPVWNEMLPPLSLPDCGIKEGSSDFSQICLTIDIFHSKPSETPKPLVGTARIALDRLFNDQYPNFRPLIKTLELRRPSGRPHGKIRIKLALTERPAPPPPPPPADHIYQIAPPPPRPPSGYNYYPAAPPLPPVSTRDYGRYSPASPPPTSYTSPYSYTGYSDLYTGSGYYSAPAYYSAPPAPAISPPYYNRTPTVGYGGPSAPVEYSSGPPSYYEQKTRGSKAELGTGLAVGAVAGALGGVALEETAVEYEEDKTAVRVGSIPGARDDYGDYRDDY